MSTRAKNKALVEKILAKAKYFKSEGNAEHDGLLIVQVQDTPNDTMGGNIILEFDGCICAYEKILRLMADANHHFSDAIIEVASEIAMEIIKQEKEANQN